MGYYSVGDGKLTLSRSLVWGEYCYSPYLLRPESSTALVFWECLEISYTSEGQGEAHRTAIHIEWRDADSSRKCDVLSELTEFAILLRSLGVTVMGWLVRAGENIGDVERYTIIDGAVVSEKAELRWPDGSTV